MHYTSSHLPLQVSTALYSVHFTQYHVQYQLQVWLAVRVQPHLLFGVYTKVAKLQDERRSKEELPNLQKTQLLHYTVRGSFTFDVEAGSNRNMSFQFDLHPVFVSYHQKVKLFYCLVRGSLGAFIWDHDQRLLSRFIKYSIRPSICQVWVSDAAEKDRLVQVNRVNSILLFMQSNLGLGRPRLT